MNCCAFAFWRGGPHAPTMTFNDGLANIETETQSAGFGCEKRIKNLADFFFGDAGPGIGYGKFNVTVFSCCCFDR